MPAERAFSKGKSLVSDQRASLASETIQALQRLKDWLENDLSDDIQAVCNGDVDNS